MLRTFMKQKLSLPGAKTGAQNADYVATDSIEMLLYAFITMITDATVANRRLLLQLLDATPTVQWQADAGVVQTASLTWNYNLNQAVPRETAVVAGVVPSLIVPIPQMLVFPKGWTLRAKWDAGVAGDSFTTRYMIAQP